MTTPCLAQKTKKVVVMVNKGTSKKTQGDLGRAKEFCTYLTSLSRWSDYLYDIQSCSCHPGYDFILRHKSDPDDIRILLYNVPAYVLPNVVGLILKFGILEGFFIKEG